MQSGRRHTDRGWSAHCWGAHRSTYTESRDRESQSIADKLGDKLATAQKYLVC